MLLLLTNVVFASNVLEVNNGFYHIDNKKHIIVVNQKISSSVFLSSSEYKTQILFDKLYDLEEPIKVIDTSKYYVVKVDGIDYVLYFTELPIINIDTEHVIVDTPSVLADFSMSETNGTVSRYSIGVEIRGGSSQSRPKKSYELSFLTDKISGTSQDVTFLSMRTDNKWNLQAIYNEPLRVRSKVANELWQDIHQIYYKGKEPEAKNGIDMAYAEVFINSEYKGIYTLSERVDRKQLKLKKYSNGITGELYKGSYWDKPVVYSGLYDFNNKNEEWGGFEYKHPEEETNWSNIYNFIDFVINSNDQVFNEEYSKKFNVANAVDYFILLNLLRATDNTGKNLYIAKYKVGEPYYYVPWDLDGVLGTDWTGNRSNYTNDILSNGFYDRLLKDRSTSGFCAKIASRWRELRASVITEESIMSKFENENNYLADNNAYEREMLAWDEYKYNVSDLSYTKAWLKNRIAFLDKTFAQYESVLSAKISQDNSIKIYPNPVNGYMFIECDAQVYEVCIQDINGKIVSVYSLKGNKNKIDVSNLSKGMYLATLKSEKSFVKKKIIVD